MFRDAFIKLDPAQAARMIEVVNSYLDHPFEISGAGVMVHDLSFYKGYFLTEITRGDVHPPLVRSAVCNDKGEVDILNGTNDTIYKLNAKAPLILNDETAKDYIKFFFHYVRGKHGRFLIVDSVDDIDWREEPAPAGRKALARMIEPLAKKSTLENGDAVYTASMIFKDSLFQAEVHVRPDGHLSLNKEELLVEGIPVADDLFGQ